MKTFASFLKYLTRKFDPPTQNWLGRKTPFSPEFGTDRGAAIDRKYIESFLAFHEKDIQGKMLEIGGDSYTYMFGKALNSTAILAGPSESARSICYPDGDLTDCRSLADLDKYDCVIATNVLNFIFDTHAAIRGLASLVQPDTGSVLVTVAGLAPISRFDYDRWGDFWRFNDMSMRQMFELYFKNVTCIAYGNAPLAAAFIMGLSQEDVPAHLYEHNDPNYQIMIAVRAMNPKSIGE
ncbi:MAG: hypothetical protein P8L39_05225 [Halioglobus sp.]|nr:hypothetical protein [Halioglobus sp.]